MSVGSNTRELLIIACECECYLGRLSSAAVQALSKKAEVSSLMLQQQADAILLNKEIERSERCIGVDGCEKQCISKILKELKIGSEFYLILIDLGIEELGEVEVTTDDLQLAMDGITAESTPVAAGIPRIPGCCCC